MPGVSGLEAIRIVVEHASTTRVLVLSVSAEARDIDDAMTAGAGGYVLKDEPVEDLIAAVRATAVGHRRISPGSGRTGP